MISFPSDQWRQLRCKFVSSGFSVPWPKGHRLSREWFNTRLVDFTFWYFVQGRGTLIDHGNGGREYPIHAGICLCMGPGMDLELRQADPDFLGDFYLHMDLYSGKRRLRSSEWPKFPFYTEVANTTLFKEITERLAILLNPKLDFSKEARNEDSLEAELLVKGLLIHLGREHQESAAGKSEANHKRVITATLSALYQSPARFRSVSDLASASGYSYSHFRQVCTMLTGEKPGDLIIRARIEQAKRYLRGTSLSIGMIAASVGYENIYYFSRQFREVTGLTASQFRAQGG